METTAVYDIETALATLKVYEDYCVLTAKKNLTTLFITNKFFAGEKKFYFSDLTSVQYRAPGTITDGYLEFEYPGSRSGNSSGAYSSENSISFAKRDAAKMEEIYHYIDQKIHELKRPQAAAAAAPSPAEELKKFKKLLDMGVISQEEFDSKKKQLLGL